MSFEQSHNDDTHDARVGEVLNEFLDARARGEVVRESDLFKRHPELANALREHLEILGELQPTNNQISQLIAQGRLSSCEDTSVDGSPYLARLGPYKIIDVLGRGGMGIVLKAYDDQLARVVALKILRPELACDRTALARFTREAKAAAKLNHPNIVSVYYVDQDGETPYFVMEYVEGYSLADLVNDVGPLPTTAIRNILRQILTAISTAHRAGLVHRDVKSSNILMEVRDSSGIESPGYGEQTAKECSNSAIRVPHCVKLADFGLARIVTAQTRLTLGDAILGTPEYMSPEQARGDEDIDQRTDLYSVGVVLYEMLTGRTPFKADSPSAVIHQILNIEAPEPRSIHWDVDPVLASLALRLMAKRREDRMDTGEQVLSALDNEKRVSSREGRRRRHRKLVKWCTVAASILMVLILIWAYTSVMTDIIVYEEPDGKHVKVKRPIWGWMDFPVPLDVVNAAALVDIQGDGCKTALVGGIPIDHMHLFHLNSIGQELYATSLNPAEETWWPGNKPQMGWTCRALLPYNLDGEPGDEVVISIGDWKHDHCILSLYDPRTHTDEPIFRHYGHIGAMFWLEDYFGEGHPAIMAWGCNGALGGLEGTDPSPGVTCAVSDLVWVVMILDPRRLRGDGPGMTEELASGIHAYAYINLPGHLSEKDSDETENQEQDVVVIDDLQISNFDPVASTNPVYIVFLKCHISGEQLAELHIDGHLEIQQVILVDNDKTEDYWKEHWTILVQDGVPLPPLMENISLEQPIP